MRCLATFLTTIGDYRQLSDALFHAGAGSGSEFEYVDEANRLHFYVLGKQRTKSGELSYTVAIRSLDGSGPQRRGVRLLPADARMRGWSVWVPNDLAAAEPRRTGLVTVYAERESGSHLGRISLTATSESDASKDDSATCLAVAR
jgi:hypothetical protein